MYMRFGGVPSLFGGFKFEEVHETNFQGSQGSRFFIILPIHNHTGYNQ